MAKCHQIRVTAPAVHGKANKAVIGIISSTIGVPSSAVSVIARAYLISEKGED